jgi:hypothetical protein
MPFTVFVPFNCKIAIEITFSSQVEDSCQIDVEGHGKLFACNNQIPVPANLHTFTWPNTEKDILQPSQPKYPDQRVDIHVNTKGVPGPSDNPWTEKSGVQGT